VLSRQLLPNVVVGDVALGESDSEADLYLDPADPTSVHVSLDREVFESAKGRANATRKVSVRRLDSVAREQGWKRIDLLKIDTEDMSLRFSRSREPSPRRSDPGNPV